MRFADSYRAHGIPMQNDGSSMESHVKSPTSHFPSYQEQPQLVMALFMLFTVAFYMCWGARRDVLATIRFEFQLGIIVGLICVFVLVAKKPNMAPAKSVLWGIGLLLLAMVVQLPFAADPINSRIMFIDRVVKFAMLTFFISVLIHSPRDLRWFLLAFLLACFYITQESVRGLISGSLVWQNQGVMRLHGSVRMYAHPNSLAGLAMGTLPFIYYMFPAIRSWFWRLCLIPPFVTALICVVYSGSRTAYVAILVLIMYLYFTSTNKKRFFKLGLVVGVIAFFLLPQQYKERFMSIGGQEKEGKSKEERILILQDAWIIFKDNPVGIGVASFPAVRAARFGRKQDTHNLYLEVATNLGIQGLVVFLFLVTVILLTYRRVCHAFVRQRRTLDKAIRIHEVNPALRKKIRNHLIDLDFLIAICNAGSAFIIVRLALGLFGMDLYEVYWWFASGLAICLANMAWRVRERTRFLVHMIDPKPSSSLNQA